MLNVVVGEEALSTFGRSRPADQVHGCRHTVATLLLQAGVPVQVVAQRLGHAQISMTLELYAHALPDMQKDAAAKLGALLAGS